MTDSKIIAIITLGIVVLMYSFGVIESRYACQAEKVQIQMLQKEQQ